jgi:hypothetical protein
MLGAETAKTQNEVSSTSSLQTATSPGKRACHEPLLLVCELNRDPADTGHGLPCRLSARLAHRL